MTWRFINLIRIFFLAFFLLASSHARASLFEDVAPSVVKLTLRYHGIAVSSGTGFFIAGDGSVLTNRHVVRNLIHESGYSLEVSSYTDRRARLVSRFEVGSCGEKTDADLCILRLPHDFAGPALQLATQAPRIGERALTIGHPGDRNFAFSSGVVKSFEFNPSRVEEMLVTTPVGAGSSGGPVFNDQGRLIGVVSRYSSNGNPKNFALSLSEVRNFLDHSSTPTPVAIARERIDAAIIKRDRAESRQAVSARRFTLGDEILTLDLPDRFRDCREVRKSVFACSADFGIFSLQRFEVTNSNPLISGRTLLSAQPLEIVTKLFVQPAATPLEEKRREAFFTRPQPASCNRIKFGEFSHSQGCEFSVLNDTEISACSQNIWIQKGSKIYSFATWTSDSSRSELLKKISERALQSARFSKIMNEARAEVKTPSSELLGWPFQRTNRPPDPHPALLTSSQDR